MKCISKQTIMCYDDSTQNIRNLYRFKDLYIGIIVLVVKRRGFFGHIFRFGFNGQHRKQIEQKGAAAHRFDADKAFFLVLGC